MSIASGWLMKEARYSEASARSVREQVLVFAIGEGFQER